MEVQIYLLTYPTTPVPFTSPSFSPHSPHSTLEVGQPPFTTRYQADVSRVIRVETPVGAELVPNQICGQVLRWELDGREVESDPMAVLAFCNHRMHGFRELEQH